MQPHVEHDHSAVLNLRVLLHPPHLFFKGAGLRSPRRQHIVVTVKVWPEECDASSECAHVNINGACYRNGGTLIDQSAHPISVPEVTNNEVVGGGGGGRHWPLTVREATHNTHGCFRAKRGCVFGVPCAPGSLLLNVDGINQRARMLAMPDGVRKLPDSAVPKCVYWQGWRLTHAWEMTATRLCCVHAPYSPNVG